MLSNDCNNYLTSIGVSIDYINALYKNIGSPNHDQSTALFFLKTQYLNLVLNIIDFERYKLLESSQINFDQLKEMCRTHIKNNVFNANTRDEFDAITGKQILLA